MSTLEKDLYKIPSIGPSRSKKPAVQSKAYKGISTANPDNTTFSLYDINLIKQDLINHFHIRKGEKLENPTFGTIIWDLLFEPLTPALKDAIVRDVETIINYDPRTRAKQVIVDSYENGIQIECELTYLSYSISEKLRMRFDRDNGIST